MNKIPPYLKREKYISMKLLKKVLKRNSNIFHLKMEKIVCLMLLFTKTLKSRKKIGK